MGVSQTKEASKTSVSLLLHNIGNNIIYQLLTHSYHLSPQGEGKVTL